MLSRVYHIKNDTDNTKIVLWYMKGSRSMSGLDWPSRRKGRLEWESAHMGQAKWKIQLILYGSTIRKRVWWQTPRTRMFKLNGGNSIKHGNRRGVATPLLATEAAAAIQEREREQRTRRNNMRHMRQTNFQKQITNHCGIADHQMEQMHANLETISKGSVQEKDSCTFTDVFSWVSDASECLR